MKKHTERVLLIEAISILQREAQNIHANSSVIEWARFNSAWHYLGHMMETYGRMPEGMGAKVNALNFRQGDLFNDQ